MLVAVNYEYNHSSPGIVLIKLKPAAELHGDLLTLREAESNMKQPSTRKKIAPIPPPSSAERTKQNRFLRVFVMFIIFISITIIMFQRTSSDHDLIYTATHILDGTDVGKLLNSSVSNFPVLNNMLHANEVSPKTSLASSSDSGSQLDKSLVESLIHKARDLQHRTDEMLLLITDTSISETKPFIRWDLVSNAEVHILHKLSKFLKTALSSASSAASYEDFAKFIHIGYQCSSLQAAQQETISKFISMDICSEVEWYKVVQLAWPEATEFIDVGANKGYLGSLFLSLWGGGGLGLAPSDVFSIATKKNLWKDSRNPAGYCKDGYNQASALYCPPPNKRVWSTARCNMVNNDVRVTSIDGSSYLAQTLNRVMREEAPKLPANVALREGKLWRYLNYAVSDVNGVATFTKQTAETNAGFEGGHIHESSAAQHAAQAASNPPPTSRKRLLRGAGCTEDALSNESSAVKSEGFSSTGLDEARTLAGESNPNSGTSASIHCSRHLAAAQTEEVKMTTIDSFVASEGMTRLDVLKIDTEGNDNKVLLGAKDALRHKLGMVTFEGGKGVTLSREMLLEFDSLGFSCYSTSRAGLFKWSGGCMQEKFMGGFNAKDKGNVFCVSRHRAPMAALAYDVLSFPMLIEDYLKTTAGAAAGASSIGTAQGAALLLNDSTVGQVQPQDLTPIYINIKPFCSPWPMCSKV